MVEEITTALAQPQLLATDRCDRCGSQAQVRATMLTGMLLFCGHHYNKIMDNPDSYKKMMAFMLTIVDEREKLIDDK